MGTQEELKGTEGQAARTQGAAGGLVEATQRLVEQYVDPTPLYITGGKHTPEAIVLGEKQKMLSLQSVADAVRERPVFAKGVSNHLTLGSLTEHAKRWLAHALSAPSAAVAFAQHAPARVEVVYDYDSPEGNGWRGHRAKYDFPVSPEWTRWTAVFNEPLSTSDLATLLEDRLADVATREMIASSGVEIPMGLRPAQPAELLALSEGLAVNVSRKIREIRRRDNGTADLAFVEEHETRDASGKPLAIPNGFVLGLSPFIDGQLFAVPVRLRYALRSGEVVWTLTAHNADVALRRCVQAECARFAEATGIPLFWGTPEPVATVR